MSQEIDISIYKKDSKGKLRVLNIKTDNGELIQIHGMVGGSLVSHSKICTPKNAGKSNETTPLEQAISEAKSLILEKKDEGYCDTAESAMNSNLILPMLAHEFNKHKSKIDWNTPVFIQPKLDGMRALGRPDGFMSRAGKVITTVDHILPELKFLTNYLGGITVDGELYAHGKTFQENMSLIKKYRPGLTEQIKYRIYDMVFDTGFAFRYDSISNAIHEFAFQYIELVPTSVLNNIEDLPIHHARFLAEGYEGSIIRHGSKKYEPDARSFYLLKYKDFKDVSLPILTVTSEISNPEFGGFVFTWPGALGHRLGPDILGCGMKFSHEDRKKFLENKEMYIGKTAELRFFEYSDIGVPRFPVCVGIRLDK